MRCDEIETNALYVKPQLRFLGLSSHIGGGKDYIASYLQKTLEKKVEIVKFATKLVSVTAEILGVSDLSLFQDREWKEKKRFWLQGHFISPRAALCIVGSLMRSVDPDIWVRALANSCTADDTLYVISDLRYQNELDFVQQNNGVVVFIENLQAAQNQHRKEYVNDYWQPHDSEELVWRMHYHDIQPDYVLDNNDYSDPKPLQDLVTFIESV